MSAFYSSTKYSCQICIILATGCQNLGRFNRRLSEVLSTTNKTTCKIPTNEEVSCFKSLRRRIYHADKC